MLDLLKEEANWTRTENGAVTPISTGSDCLDLFATIGALRNAEEREVTDRFLKAFTENKDAAMKILFFARDIREGLGERRVFRTILNKLASFHRESVKKNFHFIAEFGRYDDFLSLFDTPLEEEMLCFLKERFEEDRKAEKPSLLAKWLPSINATSVETKRLGKKVAKAFGLSEKEYRKELVRLRKKIDILENYLREREYSFYYERQPSKALFKYRAAFIRNDRRRYQEFLAKVENGEAKLHTDTLCPYELVLGAIMKRSWTGERTELYLTEEEKKSLNVTWEALHDFGGEEDILPIIDTSGSMYAFGGGLPAAVAISLGLYFAERNKGRFRGHFIEFSETPRLIEVKGETFVDRLNYVLSFSEVANTNLQAVFDLILRTAVKNNIHQEELPKKLVLISDMEFDSCVENAGLSNFDMAKEKFQKAGYRLPEIVFWNVESRKKSQPVTKNEQGVVLVSGVTPRLFSMVAGGNLSPYHFMMEVLEKERYQKIVA